MFLSSRWGGQRHAPKGTNDLQHHQFFCRNFVWAFSGLVHVIGALFGCILHAFYSFVMLLEPILAILLLFSTFVPFHRCVLCIPHCSIAAPFQGL